MTKKLNLEKQDEIVNKSDTSSNDIPEIIEVLDVVDRDTNDKDDFMVVK
jgi:hypothetical protein